MRNAVTLAAIYLAILTIAPAQIVTIQDLGSLGGSSVGLAVNNRGQVAGYSNSVSSTEKHAFFKPAGLIMADLNFYTSYASATSHGYAINHKGAVAGSIDPYNHNLSIAFLWDGSSPTITTLGTLGGGMSEALGINASGQVTGWASQMDGKSHAIVSSSQGLIDIGVLPGGTFSSGTAINNAGQITGWSYTAGATKPRAFLYNPGMLMDIGQGLDSIGNAINSLGHIAGQWAGHAAVYTPRTGVVRIPGLEDVISDAKSINSLGQVVGVYSSAGATNVYVYTPGGKAVDLNGLLAPNSGWQIKTAWSINDFGQVTGDGLYNGTSHAYILNLPRCDVSLPVTAQQFGAFGGSGTLVVNSRANGCDFAPVTSAADWVVLGTPAGTGTRLIPFTIRVNLGPSTRTATITVANRAFYVVQLGMSIPVPKFVDVPVSNAFYESIRMVAAEKITSGCVASPAQFCPEEVTTRGQMAVFITRSLFGGDTFSYSATPYFDDVPGTHPFFKHIQKMRDLSITSGCSAQPALYCPDAKVSRGQMAVFLVRALLGDDFEYGTTPYFEDVASDDVWYPYIQKLRDLGITSGCSSTSYCADQPTTRGQMAVFLARAFLIPRAN
jgi:probable HAF family extracellular repeat protein